MTDDNLDKRVEAFQSALDLLEDQVDWQKEHFKDLFESNLEKSTEIHIKYSELSSVVELIKDQLKWQRDFVNNFVRDDNSLDKKMSDRVNEMSKLVSLMADKLDIQKDKLDTYISVGKTDNNAVANRLTEMKKDISGLRSPNDDETKKEIINVKGSMKRLSSANKFHGDYIKKLERKIENKQSAVKKRFKKIEDILND